ncbi:MAG: 6-carboxytetrahydropterin synthase [Acidobacteria bacterium]|nr:6-carboxytetrahydropterin synthase [Acidobacteriota bacterium]
MKIYLTRRYRFAAAHRLHNERLSDEENARLYGKCNNPHGHGHNYTLEVTVAGPLDPRTGMVMNLADLDASVEQEVLERFDHVHLNLDVESFRSRVPTTENLCREVFALLRPRIEGKNGAGEVKLARVRLEETRSNFFEYAG